MKPNHTFTISVIHTMAESMVKVVQQSTVHRDTRPLSVGSANYNWDPPCLCLDSDDDHVRKEVLNMNTKV